MAAKSNVAELNRRIANNFIINKNGLGPPKIQANLKLAPLPPGNKR
jgi:hypothetical protein